MKKIKPEEYCNWHKSECASPIVGHEDHKIIIGWDEKLFLDLPDEPRQPYNDNQADDKPYTTEDCGCF